MHTPLHTYVHCRLHTFWDTLYLIHVTILYDDYIPNNVTLKIKLHLKWVSVKNQWISYIFKCKYLYRQFIYTKDKILSKDLDDHHWIL